MNRTLIFSGMQPTVEDLVFDQDAKEIAIKSRLQDLFTDGVLRGLGVYLNGDALHLEPGVAYVAGERMEIESDQLIGSTINQGFVFLKFITLETEPVDHFITGEAFPTRRLDSCEIFVNATADPFDLAIMLCEIQNGGPIDKRSFMELKLSKPTSCDPPGGLVISTGFESDILASNNMSAL